MWSGRVDSATSRVTLPNSAATNDQNVRVASSNHGKCRRSVVEEEVGGTLIWSSSAVVEWCAWQLPDEGKPRAVTRGIAEGFAIEDMPTTTRGTSKLFCWVCVSF